MPTAPHPDPPEERRPHGALEAEVLALLQASAAPLTPGEARGLLSDRLAYSTVVTVLSRMHEKGLLTRRKQGRAYAYAPVDDAPGLTARRMHREMDRSADRETVLTRFVDGLSAADEDLLRQLLGTDLPDGG